VGVRDERGREQQNIEYRIMNNEVKGKKRERTAEYRISNIEQGMMNVEVRFFVALPPSPRLRRAGRVNRTGFRAGQAWEEYRILRHSSGQVSRE